MPRRTLLAFAVTFLAALAVFTAPRFVWNTVARASAQTPQRQTSDVRAKTSEMRTGQTGRLESEV